MWLAAQAKMGYYPTPPMVVSLVEIYFDDLTPQAQEHLLRTWIQQRMMKIGKLFRWRWSKGRLKGLIREMVAEVEGWILVLEYGGSGDSALNQYLSYKRWKIDFCDIRK